MKSNELFSYLTDLEVKLNSFSFEELTSDEATRLKKSFQSFKDNLEGKKLQRINNSIQRNTLLRQEEDKSVSSHKRQETLLTKISQEIRTPLNDIIGLTEELSEEKLSETQLFHINAIQYASNTLLNSLNELLEYSKLKPDSSSFESVDFNIKNLLKEVCFLCDTLIVNPNVDFKICISEDIPNNLVGDPSKLSQILLNLIGNTIKCVTKASIDLTVNVVGLEEDTIVLNFTIRSRSIGIEEKDLINIFDYAKQADNDTHKNNGSASVGLRSAYDLIDSLNGKLTVRSEVGVGSIFNFSLPYQNIQLQKNTSNTPHLNTIKNMKNPPVISKVSSEDSFDVDLTPVLEDCFGDMEMLEELVRLFKQNAIEFIGKTKIDLKAKNIEGLRFNTHKIKSGLKMMQTFGLFRIAEQMHKICLEDHDFKYLSFLFDCFLKEYTIVENAIEEALESLKNSN